MKKHQFSPLGDWPLCAYVEGIHDDSVCSEEESSAIHLCGFINIKGRICIRPFGHESMHGDDITPFHQAAYKEEAMTVSKYARLQYATLACGEFFRDELQWGNIDFLSPRIAQKMQELRTVCFNALDDPSVADAARIRQKVERNKK